jgi:hypothetical protein
MKKGFHFLILIIVQKIQSDKPACSVENGLEICMNECGKTHALSLPKVFIGCFLCSKFPDSGYALVNKIKPVLCSSEEVRM